MLFSASDNARLNSRSPLPTALPASGSRLAPKTSSTMSIRIRISLPLRFPNPIPGLLLIEALWSAAGGRRNRGIRGLRRFDLLDLFQPTLEFLDPFPDRRADLRNPLGAEEQHQDQQEDRDFGKAEVWHCTPFLEERAGDEIRDDHAHHGQQRHVESYRSERNGHNQQIQVNRTDRRCHRPGEHFLRRTLRQKASHEGLHQPAHDKPYRKHTKIEERTAWPGWHG